LFTLALEDFRAYCEQAGKQIQFQIFQEYDLADSVRPAYADLARRHAISVTALNNYLAWSRRMLRAHLTERLRGVTSGDPELRHELRSALGRP
jgi:hypothetical protein